MSNFKLQMDGLAELRQQLRNLPEDLAKEAGEIVKFHAEAAASEIENNYPVRTTNLRPGLHRKSSWFPPGNLVRRVTTATTLSRVSMQAIVRSRAPHAHLFEFGTERRTTDRGANRGRMPKAPASQAMIPKVIRWRRKMVDALKALCLRHGASEVSE